MSTELEANKELVKTALERAFFDYEIDGDGDVYVKSGIDFPFWITVDGRFVCIMTFVTLNMDLDDIEQKATLLGQRIMDARPPNMVFVRSGKLVSAYYLPCTGGINQRHLIEMLRYCADSFVSGVREFDVDNIVS